jgi:Domain of unknown function (DUF4919)
MNRRQVFANAALIVAVIATRALGAQTPAKAPSVKAADSVYLALLRPLRESGDTTIDVTGLRRALAATSFYSPYDNDRDEQRHRMWARLDANDAAGASLIADSLLSVNYLDFDTHIGAGAAAKESGDSIRAQKHFAIARAIVRSIESTGDGRSPDHPLFVIAPSEEYSYLGVVGLRRSGMQSLTKCRGQACDALEVTPRSGGEKFTMFFEVSLALDWMTRSLSGGDIEAAPGKPR